MIEGPTSLVSWTENAARSLTNGVKWDGQWKRKLKEIEGNGRFPPPCGARSDGARAMRESDQDVERELRQVGQREMENAVEIGGGRSETGESGTRREEACRMHTSRGVRS